MTDQFDALSGILANHGSEIIDPLEGIISCPGIQFHNTPNAASDCKVWFNDDGTTIANCFHQSCREEIRLLNLDLLRHVRGGRAHLSAASPRSIYQMRDNGDEELVQIAKDALPEILSSWPWPMAQIVHDSPEKLGDVDPDDQWRALLCGLFEPDDVVWCGRDRYDTGSPGHRWRFRAVSEWLQQPRCPGVLTCPNTFHAGAFSRGKSDVACVKHLVVESDCLTHDQSGAVFRYLQESELTLRAIVDSGGKSLHAWFDVPTHSQMAVLKAVLPALGGDGAMFTPCQPCRLPGALRLETGRLQRLIYINPQS